MGIQNMGLNLILISGVMASVNIYTFFIIANIEYILPVLINILQYILIREQNIIKYECYRSSVHATVLFFSSLLYYNNYILDHVFRICLNYSIVYNLGELIYCNLNYQYILHHVILIIAIITCYINKITLVYISLNFICEITQIPLNISYYYHKSNIINVYSKIANTTTVVLYFPFRILLNLYLLYLEYINNIYYYIIFIQFSLFILNCFWFYKLLNLVRSV